MFKNSIKVLTVAAAAAALVACGGGSDGFIAKDKKVTIDPTTGPKVLAKGQTYVFPIGTFGLTEAVELTLPDGGAGNANLKSGNKTATADFSFGSCVFRNVTPDFGDLKAVGGKFNCSVVYTKPGQSAAEVDTVLIIDGKSSTPFKTKNVKVNSDGNVVVNGTAITGGGN